MYKRLLYILTLAFVLMGFSSSVLAAPDINMDEDVADEPAKAIAYRYWIDDDINHKTVVPMNGDDITCNVDVSALSAGVHTYHVQLQNQDRRWGNVTDIAFYAGFVNTDVKDDDAASAITRYEYWFDDDFAGKVSAPYTQPDISFDKDISGMSGGKHTFTFVAVSESGGIGAATGGFYLPDTTSGGDEGEKEEVTVTSYQYWIDDDKSNGQILPYTSDDITSNIDYSAYSGGAHIFNFRLKNSEGVWSRNTQIAFYIPETQNPEQAEVAQPITGYRYGVNGRSQEQGLTEIDNVPSLNVEIGIPSAQDVSDVESFEFSTTDNTNIKVKRNYDITYYVQFKNKADEWSAPVFADSIGADSTMRAAKELALQQTVGVRKLGKGDYSIVKFNIAEENGYYFGASKSCQVMLYQDNERKMTFSADDMVNNRSTLLSPGNYFAVIYNQPEDGSVRLSNTNNYVGDPTFNYADHNLSIGCGTDGATIYYTLDGTMPTRESATYTGPLAMSSNTRVRALACVDGMADSYVQSYLVSDFETQTCADPVFAFDGRTVTMSSESKLADIYYTLDGSDPTAESQLYNMDHGIQVTEAGVIKAIAIADLMNNSNAVSFEVPSYYDGESKVSIRKAGNLSKAFEWCGGKPSRSTLNVTGNVNDADVQALATMDNVRVLDMSNATAENNSIGDRAFAGMNVLSVSLPTSLTTCGNELFAGCAKLAAVMWNSSAIMPANALDGINNPNLLLYVNAKSAAPANVANVVASGVAESITLSDATDQTTEANFYCPKAFTAQKISYTRNFTQKTEMGVCQGWETIVLPFTVSTMRHETNGNVAPFAKGEQGAKPFWLYELSPTGGFMRAANIQANVPYVISMPNSEYYADDYILGGKVTFTGDNVTVSATSSQTAKNDSREFVPCYEWTPKAMGIYTLNVNEEYENYRPGSLFVENLLDVKPFEAYLKTVNNYSISTLSIFGDEETTGIDNIPTKQLAGINAWAEGSTLYISSDAARRVPVFNTSGMLVKSVSVEAGETTSITDLPSGIYIVNKKKVALQ